jgi:DNA-binding transcriptional LysR family regulator
MNRSVGNQVALTPLHAGQVDAYWALKPRRFKALRSGRRFGKTDFGIAQGLTQGYASINNGHALLAAAQSGLGIILQPESLVSRDMEQGRLVHILPEWSTTSSSLHIVYLIDRQMPPKLRRFVQFVAERFS